MRFWNFVLSKIEGRKPTVNQLDHETIAKNIRSGSLYVLRESAAGVKEVIEVAGGPPGTSDPHLRAHQIDSADDHPPVAEAKRGKLVATNEATGAVELLDKDQVGAILDVFAADDPFFPALQNLFKTKPAGNEVITILQKPQGLVWGGVVTWVEVMDFHVSRAIYYITGDAHFAPDTVLTITDADLTLDRIDLVVANDNDTFSIITGVPGANPVKPGINPLTQVEVTQINVPAGTTNYGGLVGQVIIYNENTEWAGSSSGVIVDFDSLISPYLGSKCADVGAIGNLDTISFVGPTALLVADYKIFSMFLKLKSTMAKNESLFIQFLHGETVVSSEMVLSFNKAVSDWQNVYFNIQDVKWTGTQFDTVKFIYRRPNGDFAGFYLDYIKIESGIVPPVVAEYKGWSFDALTESGIVKTLIRSGENAFFQGKTGSRIKLNRTSHAEYGNVLEIDFDEEGLGGDSSYVYIAYASDDSGTGFTMTFNPALDYIAILAIDTEIPAPAVGDFTGLWKKYKGEDGTEGEDGAPGVDGADGVGVPPGGTLGQVLTKSSEDDFDTSWQDPAGGGGGSTQLTAIPATDKTASGITTQLTAFEAQAFGDVVKINSSGKAQIAKADVIANATGLAMCVSESVEADATGTYLLIGFVRNDAWDWTIGGDIFLTITGTSGNTLSQTSPFAADPIVEDTIVQLLGVANSADTIYFNPQLVQVELKPN